MGEQGQGQAPKAIGYAEREIHDTFRPGPALDPTCRQGPPCGPAQRFLAV